MKPTHRMASKLSTLRNFIFPKLTHTNRSRRGKDLTVANLISLLSLLRPWHMKIHVFYRNFSRLNKLLNKHYIDVGSTKLYIFKKMTSLLTNTKTKARINGVLHNTRNFHWVLYWESVQMTGYIVFMFVCL